MRRGTTPRHGFEAELIASEVKRVELTYKQADRLILTKTEQDCTITDSEISVILTQEETLSFTADVCITIQLRVLFTDGTVVASDIFREPCEDCQSPEVLA